jgi:hypothetical protein
MTVDLSKMATTFSGGTLSCMVAMNLDDLGNMFDMSQVQMGAKTGGVLVVLTLLRMAGGLNIKSGKAE